jgi:hypothetical protein
MDSLDLEVLSDSFASLLFLDKKENVIYNQIVSFSIGSQASCQKMGCLN